MKFVFGFCLFVITGGCGWPGLFPKPENPQAVSLKVINYNLWHGLGQGLLKRKEIEEYIYNSNNVC